MRQLVVNLLSLLMVPASYSLAQAAAIDVDAELRRIDSVITDLQTPLNTPFEDLAVKLKAALEQAVAEAQKKGDLDGVLATKRALTDFENRTLDLTTLKSAPLAELFRVYFANRRKMTEKSAPALRKVEEQKRALLKGFEERLTKAGQIGDAVRVRAAIDALPPPLGPEKLLLVQHLIGKWDCASGRIHIRSDGTMFLESGNSGTWKVEGDKLTLLWKTRLPGWKTYYPLSQDGDIIRGSERNLQGKLSPITFTRVR